MKKIQVHSRIEGFIFLDGKLIQFDCCILFKAACDAAFKWSEIHAEDTILHFALEDRAKILALSDGSAQGEGYRGWLRKGYVYLLEPGHYPILLHKTMDIADVRWLLLPVRMHIFLDERELRTPKKPLIGSWRHVVWSMQYDWTEWDSMTGKPGYWQFFALRHYNDLVHEDGMLASTKRIHPSLGQLRDQTCHIHKEYIPQEVFDDLGIRETFDVAEIRLESWTNPKWVLGQLYHRLSVFDAEGQEGRYFWINQEGKRINSAGATIVPLISIPPVDRIFSTQEEPEDGG